MKWVDGLIRDGSYSLFKVYTQTALKNKINSFGFKDEQIPTQYAIAVCEYIDNHHKQNIKPMLLDVSINQLNQFKDETNNFNSN